MTSTTATKPVAAGRSGNRLWRRLQQLGILGISQAGIVLLAFATQVLLARSLSQAEFGALMATMSTVTLAGPLAIFGVGEFWLQRFGREGARAFRWVRPSVLLIVACSLVQVLVLVGWGLVEKDPVAAGIRIVLSSVVLSFAGIALAGSALQLTGAYEHLAVLQLVPHVGRLLVAALTWLLGLSALAAAVGYAVTAVLTVVLSVLVVAPFWYGRAVLAGHPPGRPGRPPRFRHLVGGAAPFLLGSLFYQLTMHAGIVVSGELLSREAAALLAVPMALLTAFYVLPRVVYQQYFLAKLHRWSRSDRDAILIAYRAGTIGMIALGVSIAAAVAIGGWYAIPLVFGTEYRESVPVMMILALAIPLRFGAASVEALLTSGGLVRTKVRYQGLGALAYIGALAVAIPMFGVTGAAAATILSEAFLLGLYWSCVRRKIIGDEELPPWREIRRRIVQ